MEGKYWFLVFSRIFFAGGCYGLWLTEDMMLQCVGIFFAIAIILDTFYTFGLVDKE